MRDKTQIRTHEDLVRLAGLDPRPSFYRGLGTQELNRSSQPISIIYEKINKLLGAGPAQEYAKMIMAIPQLNTTTFLSTFYAFCDNHYKWEPSLLKHAGGIDFEDPSGDRAKEADLLLGTLMAALYQPRDNTYEIKERFIKRHGFNLSPSLEDKMGPSLKKSTKTGKTPLYSEEKDSRAIDNALNAIFNYFKRN